MLFVTQTWRATLNFVFPPHCLLCREALPETPGICVSCRAGFVDWKREEQVLRFGQDLSQVFISYEFDDSIRSLIHALKYRGKTLPGQILGEILGGRISAAGLFPSVIVPVPLHSARRRERGYNQSEVIARAVGRVLKCQVSNNMLTRVRATPSQTHLGGDERKKNMDGAFRVNKSAAVHGQIFLLIDDVITTGATVNACAQALIEAGAKEVVVGAVACPQIDEADQISVTADLQP